MINIEERAWELVNRESPASSFEARQWLVKKLMEISIREDEPLERSWIITSYWET